MNSLSDSAEQFWGKNGNFKIGVDLPEAKGYEEHCSNDDRRNDLSAFPRM